MKIVLLNTRDGLMLKKIGEYTAELREAMAFQTTGSAADYCRTNGLSDHNVALQFSDAAPDIRMRYSAMAQPA